MANPRLREHRAYGRRGAQDAGDKGEYAHLRMKKGPPRRAAPDTHQAGRRGLVLAVAGVPLAAVFAAIPERVAGGLNRAAVRRTVFAGVPACLGGADVRWIDSAAYLLLVAADSVTAADRDRFLQCCAALCGAVDAAALIVYRGGG